MNSGILFGLGAMLAWGIMDFLAAVACRKIGDYRAFFWPQFIGFGFIIFASFFFGHPVALDRIFWLLAVAGVLDMIGFIYFYRGLGKGLVGVVSPITSMFAAVTVVLSVIFLGEKVTVLQISSIILIIIGCFLVSTDIREFLKFKKAKLAEGVKEGLIAMVAWGILFVLIAISARAVGWFMPVLIMRIFLIFPFLAFAGLKKIPLKFEWTKSLTLLIIIMAILDVSAFFILNMGMIGNEASIVAPVSAAYPLISIYLAYVFLKERMVLNQYIGAGVAISGLVLLSIV